ncbi:hypothetical protein EFK50_06420 [Nocardioides marmoriginsengisoli]|uniref:Uncharacterized protein n=1 Tax=Nocardioides marmoriginsengisoli TaxID=661483 RepID=A0A3N0CL30_9ACTN|nr:hypothetical protein EFK50_06420 [Nocardioides marmoriginsengisoli]
MTLPTPVFVAGGALCLVAGYLVGAVAGPNTPQRTTATVESFVPKSSMLCLSGESVEDEPGTDDEGLLCGTWSHSAGATVPRKGDRFRFVSMDTSGVKGADPSIKTVIYGTVVE